MANYQTVKNTLKKLETCQDDANQKEGCGVIYLDEYEKLPPAVARRKGQRRKVGYLVVPRPMTMAEWQAEYAL